MLLLNQTQDFFDPFAHLEKAPSDVFDRAFKEEVSNLTELSEEETKQKILSLERKYQQTFTEEDVNKLMFYTVSSFNVIDQVNLLAEKKLPEIDLKYWDIRDFPKIYEECLNMLFRLLGKNKRTRHKVTFKPIAPDDTVYTRAQVIEFYDELKRTIHLARKIQFIQKECTKLEVALGKKVTITKIPFEPEDFTICNLSSMEKLYNFEFLKNMTCFEELHHEFHLL